jgi:ABC-type transport system involved in cytochrome c biogenesis permease subunit
MFFLTSIVLFLYTKILDNLKNKRIGFLFKRMPPLVILDRNVKFFLFSGCILLPIGVFFGIFWALNENISGYFLNSKFITTLIIWILFCGILVLRLTRKVNSQLIFRLTVMSLVIIIISFAFGRHGF